MISISIQSCVGNIVKYNHETFFRVFNLLHLKSSFTTVLFQSNNNPQIVSQAVRASRALANLARVEFTLASCFSTSSCDTVVFDINGWSGFIYTEGSVTSDNLP